MVVLQMILGIAYLLCLLSVPLARGRLSALADVELRRTWLAAAAIAIQIGIVSLFPGDLGPLGEPLHVLCITVNGGVMPADPDALAAIGRSPASDEFINSTALEHPKLAFLGDIIPTPASWPVSNVYSVGDLLILTGAFVLLHVACGSRIVPRRFRRRDPAV